MDSPTDPYPLEPAPCRGPFSTETSGLHYLWRGWGPGWKETTIGVYDSHKEEWTLNPTTGSPPAGIYDGGLVALGNHLYSFGGYDRSSWFNSIDKLDLDTFQWSKVLTRNDSSECPVCKYGCGLVVVDKNTLGCFGGYGIGPIQPGSTFNRNPQLTNGSGWTNEFHLFDVQEGVWSTPQLNGERPSPCAYFSFTKVDKHRAVLFGGSGPGRVRVDKLYLFDFRSMEVTSVEPVQGEPWPAARSGHGACCLNCGEDHPKLLLSGGVGKNNKLLGDMWILDVNSGKWTEVTCPELVQPRHLYSLTATSLAPGLTEVLMFGGSLEWPVVSPVADTTTLRFECSQTEIGSLTENWSLVDVARNNTLGTSERLREKSEKIRLANSSVNRTYMSVLQSTQDQVRKLTQQLQAAKHWAQDAEQRAAKALRLKQTIEHQEQITRHLLTEANHHCTDMATQFEKCEDRLRKALRTSQESERRAEKAEIRIQETQHLLENALSQLFECRRQEQATQNLLEVALHQKQETEQRLSESVRHNQIIHNELEEALHQKEVIEHELEGKTKELAAHRTEIWKIPSINVSTDKIIGSGGWGEVLEGTVKVAVKRLHIAILNQRNLERLQREMKLLAAVRHPNLVQFIGAVFDQSPPLIITELLDMNLRQAYEQDQLGPGDRLSIFMDIARALDYLHQRYEPIIHRDISAPNILLQRLPNNLWKGKVSDLGSANFLQNAQTMGEGAIVYSPPEVIPRPFTLDTEPLPQTGKIDVYSYGIVVCEVIASRFPSQDTFRDIFQQVRKDHSQVYELIIKCTQKHPNDRPSMAVVLVELGKMNPF